MKIAADRVLEQQAQVGVTRTAQFPTRSGGATQTALGIPTSLVDKANSGGSNGNSGGEGSIADKYYAGGYTFSTAYNLDFWGVYRKQTEAARAQLRSTEWAQQATYSSLVENVASSYDQLRSLDAMLDIAKNTAASRSKSLEFTKKRKLQTPYRTPLAMTASPSKPRTGSSHWLRYLLLLMLLVAFGWSFWVYRQIDAVAQVDEAQPADAIAVFGAAEYSGRPSPVLHARLDHAVGLYRKQIATLVITLGGGSDKDSGNTEGGVGRDYLLANGIPFANIVAETHSIDTEQQVHRLAAIAHEYNLRHIVVVSDATHLFRIRELCQNSGLDVYTSPRPALGHIGSYDLFLRYFHEVLSYTSMRLHFDETWLHQWLDGKGDN